MKEGLFYENDELIYYKYGEPYHAGVIKVDGAIYYISSGGRAVRGQHIVHRTMANDILKRGTYTFGDDYKLIKGSYKAPKKVKRAKQKNKRRSYRIIKLDKKKLQIMAAAVMMVLLLGGVLYWVEGSMSTESKLPTETTESLSAKKIILPQFEEDVLLCTAAAKSEFDGEITLKSAVQAGDPYRSVQFAYQLSGIPGILLLSEDQAMVDVRTYDLPAGSSVVSIDNLKTDTIYYYKVVVDGQEYPGLFRTASSTRFVSIPGLVNTRDIGGYVNQDGKLVKQGLVIRGVELDGLVNASYFIPKEDLDTVQETFGFVYDMDLRNSSVYVGEYVSRLGTDVDHKFYGAPQYGQIFDASTFGSLRQIFEDLADPEKYPMYMHCTWGRDRTGTIVFLLQGILNMAEDDMVREYKLSSYVYSDIVDSTNMDVVINGLEPYEGDTLQEKIVSYLTQEVGVTEEQIDSIRDIFLG